MKPMISGTAARLLCLSVCVMGLESCSAGFRPDAKAQAQFDELQTDIQGVVKNASARAGPPITIDPYVHSAGMSHQQHKKSGHKGC